MSRLALAVGDDGPALSPISPWKEFGAYEALFLEKGATFKRLADRFRKGNDARPSELVSIEEADICAQEAVDMLRGAGVGQFGVRINGTIDYPECLRDASNPIELLYYQGIWELSEIPSLAVVGTRNPSDEGVQRTERLVREIVGRKYAVVSGLAAGIDTAAHLSAIENNGVTIAVIGTPLGEYYPSKNRELQNYIAENHLLISQVPVLRYAQQPFKYKRIFFPERNVTMSALTKGTIIVEAGETSGTRHQAEAAIKQRRKLFILDSCFNNPNVTWPRHYEDRGAIRVKDPGDIWSKLDE